MGNGARLSVLFCGGRQGVYERSALRIEKRVNGNGAQLLKSYLRNRGYRGVKSI